MNRFQGKVAIVTGGASGIGRALCEGLHSRGSTVIVADINTLGAESVAAALVKDGGQASHAKVAVTQGRSVQRLVANTVARHGRLDYMFNNAGIGLAGELRDMRAEHWRRILDIDLWGVIHGTTAAYKVMLRQGFGHIVNVASGAGLFPAAPMGTAYTTAKHAVVGLSMALRPEAASLGVKVSVACPAVVRTELLDTMIYLKVKPDRIRAAMAAFGLMSPATCARAILSGVARNRAIIPVGLMAYGGWWFYRFSPALYDLIASIAARVFRASARAAEADEAEPEGRRIIRR